MSHPQRLKQIRLERGSGWAPSYGHQKNEQRSDSAGVGANLGWHHRAPAGSGQYTRQ